MKTTMFLLAAALLTPTAPVLAQGGSMQGTLEAISPALGQYTERSLLGDAWNRPGLSKRDRSVVTLAALVSRNQTIELPRYLNLALDNGVKPAEVSELITHLAFYTGWSNAVGAAVAAKEVFEARKIGSDQLPPASPKPLPLDEKAEAARAALVSGQFGAVFPGMVRNTTEMLFKDLWLRPDLAPRDRSLVTFSALVATGQVAQIPFHLNRAMDSGLTQVETGEALTQLAFYSGWPSVFSAMPVVKDVFEKARQTMRSVMKTVLIAATLFTAMASPVLADKMEISPNGTRKTALGPQANFTGTVMVDSYFGANEHLPQTGALVTFLPGARSAWHTHPAGQMLIVTSGTGWVQEDGGKKHEIKPGDVIWCPPSIKHWHGATSSTSMSHIALSNVRDGKNVIWMEKVSDEQYNAP